MSIFTPSIAPAPQSLATPATPSTPANAAPGPFRAQLQAMEARQSSASSAATQTAYQTEPGRGAPSKAHRQHGRQASNIDTSTANGTACGQATTAIQGGTGGTSNTGGTAGTGQTTAGRVLLDDMMRGLQAYGATTSLL